MINFKEAILMAILILIPQVSLSVYFGNNYGNIYAIGFIAGLFFGICLHNSFIKNLRNLLFQLRESIEKRDEVLEKMLREKENKDKNRGYLV